MPPPRRLVDLAGGLVYRRQFVQALSGEVQPEVDTAPERLKVELPFPIMAQVDPRHGAPHVSMQIADAAGIIRGRSVFPPPPRPLAPGFFHAASPPLRRQPPRRLAAANSISACFGMRRARPILT